jgi:phosphoglycerate dehydrogenase-like enzyme
LIRVWLPDSPEAFGGLPDGIVADVWQGGDELPASKDEVEYVVLLSTVTPGVVREAVAKLPRLKTIQLLSAGVDHLLPCIPPGIAVSNGRGLHSAATAEWTVGAIVASLREFPRFALAQRDRRWDFARTEPIAGKRVLIVGYGDIGEAVERRLAGWDVTIDRVARRARPRDNVHPIDDLRTSDLLKNADVVVILVPVTDETRKLVNARFLKTMRDGALLVNAARGAIVDTDALLAELRAGRLRAALDVTDPEPLPPEHPLWQAPGLLLTPHVGGAVLRSRERVQAFVRDQLQRLAAGEPLRNVIDNRGY